MRWIGILWRISSGSGYCCMRRVAPEMGRQRKEAAILTIPAAELGRNLGKYLQLAESEDILITYNGRTVAKLCNPYQDRVDAVNFLYGFLPEDLSLEEARDDRLSKV